MDKQTAERRVAMLLRGLGSNRSESLLEHFSGDKQHRLRVALESLDEDPPSRREMGRVVDEFARTLKLVKDQLTEIAGESAEQISLAEEDEEEIPELSGNPATDVTALANWRLGVALRGEHPRAIAVVLGVLDADKASEVLRELPAETRQNVILTLGTEPKPPRGLTEKVLKAVLGRALEATPADLEEESDSQVEHTAHLLRKLAKEDRGQALELLEQTDPEVAGKVKDLLYIFDDVLRIEDRSLQKLLAEVDTTSLATSLKDADSAIVEKITSNMSKRAKSSLLEEIEFMSSVPREAQLASKKVITDAMARLDQSGELVMVEGANDA